MGDKPTSCPWRMHVGDDDRCVIKAYEEYPRMTTLTQCAQLFIISSWQIVQRELNKINYQSKRGY